MTNKIIIVKIVMSDNQNELEKSAGFKMLRVTKRLKAPSIDCEKERN